MKKVFKKILDILIIIGFLIISQYALIPMSLWLKEQGYLRLDQVLTLLIIQLLVLTIFVIFAQQQKLLRFEWKSWFTIPSLAYSLIGYLLIMGINLIGSLILYLEGRATTANQSAINEMIHPTTLVSMFVFVVIMAPLTEEIIFRGLIPRLFSKKIALLGYAVGTLLFALAHSPSNIGSFVIYFGMGSILGIIAYKSQKLEYSVLAHALNNGIAFSIMLFMLQ